MNDDQFVNPYTFVQLPKDVSPGWRSAPAGHGRLRPDRFSGVLDVALTARSPLMLRNVYDGDDAAFPLRRFPGFEEPVPFVPGSSLAGAVRSLHETLAGGCLRVFNADFRPGYRDQARVRTDSWRLALVEKVDERGAPSRLRLCRETVWAEYTALHKALGGASKLRSGARVTLLSGSIQSSLGRLELGEPFEVKEGGESVVLVTDSGARHSTRKNPDGGRNVPGRHFCATGELDPDSLEVVLPDEVWQEYLDAVDGTRDVQEWRQGPSTGASSSPEDEAVQVFHKDERLGLVGYRDPARRELRPGQVVLVDPERAGQSVRLRGISLSTIWRHPGGRTRAGERVHTYARACRDPQELCPSCRLFGSVDAEGADTDGGGARQKAYRGHVRFGDAVPAESYGLEPEFLPPMGTPKPGAGQFYLTRDGGLEGASAVTDPDKALREWGSEADTGSGRRLRGRKHYWLTGQADKRPYFRARGAGREVFHDLYGSENKLLSKAQSVPEGARFTAEVRFENLDAVALGGLLCALDPGLLLHHFDRKDEERPRYGWALGGGRPLGFGTCTAEVDIRELDSAESRYLGTEAPILDVDKAVAAFRKSAGDDLRDVWKRQLTKVLRLDWAPTDRVWYPPAQPISEESRPLNPEALKASFTFWKETSGSRTNPYVQLPSSAAQRSDMTMNVIPQKKGKGAK
ncbi:TIGR03986 family CRISPR-associated RAMP protein [Streptomyces fradiae]|uniref:TIGR03986 family type III CRISPR-associated RAMP protein n=1 Tax=Streptomyces fradiae TaxID=1906 RepID=UPI003986775A